MYESTACEPSINVLGSTTPWLTSNTSRSSESATREPSQRSSVPGTHPRLSIHRGPAWPEYRRGSHSERQRCEVLHHRSRPQRARHQPVRLFRWILSPPGHYTGLSVPNYRPHYWPCDGRSLSPDTCPRLPDHESRSRVLADASGECRITSRWDGCKLVFE